jgi:[ribosomal protein S5]-alanine N-acetyltransferase
MSRLIVTPRLVIRPWQPGDAPAAARIYTDESVAGWLLPPHPAPQSEAEIRDQLSLWCQERGEDRVPGHWAVTERASATVIGGLSLQYLPPDGGSLTISGALVPGAWGQGLAAEAGDALVRWAIHRGNALEVFALVQPNNVRARATAERIGMDWVAERGDLTGDGDIELYRIRHGDLEYEDEDEDVRGELGVRAGDLGARLE